MGYAEGENSEGRVIGYAVEGVCDEGGCEEVIHLGVEACCGGSDGWDHVNDPEKNYCGGFFCDKHRDFDVCIHCVRDCPDCDGSAHDPDGELCKRCDSFGSLGHEQPEPAVGYEAISSS